MKHLVQVMAVFLLMGCQTNNNTPKDMISPKPVAEAKQPDIMITPAPVPKAVQINKPVICGDSATILSGLIRNTEEQPVMMWNDETRGHQLVVMMNRETKTVSVLEWPLPDFVCMISSGVDASFNGELNQKKPAGFKVSN
jgi:hypothetical protein